MAEHDLSALDGLLGEIDIEEKGSEDPRAAKIQALFQRAKAEYTAKIDTPAGFITPPSASFVAATFQVPTPAELLAHRKADRTGSTGQEWTANYLYVQGHFELCLAYVVSFAVSMDIPFAFGSAEGAREVDTSQMALRRSKQERELSKNWGVIKDVVDVGMRALLTLRRSAPPTQHISCWVPCDSDAGYGWRQVELDTLAQGFLAFSMREVRVGAGDTRAGFSNMVVRTPDGKRGVDMDKVQQQNWTVTHGLALTAGDLALEFGLWRTAIEAHTLFLACRGAMWRVLMALAHELTAYADSLSSTSQRAVEALHVVAKAAVVAALQAVPRRRKVELAQLVVADHRVIPQAWIDAALQPDFTQQTPFDNEDDFLFDGLLSTEGERTVVPEEVGVALVKVVFAKKSGLLAMYDKFPEYMREYRQRLHSHGSEWDADDAHDEDGAGLRSVRTL